MAKKALLIGVSQYEPGFDHLPSAQRDVEAMCRVLRSPNIGGFEVNYLYNPLKQQMAKGLEQFFAECQKDDLALFYFSGHGIKDMNRDLYLAAHDTQKRNGELFAATAVWVKDVQRSMRSCKARQQIVILDCCMSGAFADGFTVKDGGSIDLENQLGNEGLAILTSSNGTQYSFERKEFDLSLYTHFLVNGLETGDASLSGNGLITVEELHDYISQKIRDIEPRMAPQFYPAKRGHNIALAKAPIRDPEQAYKYIVSQMIDRGEIGFVPKTWLDDLRDWLSIESRPSYVIDSTARKILDTHKERLNLSTEVTTQLEAEVLSPFVRYAQEFSNRSRGEKILSAATRQKLRQYQRTLGVTDKQAEAIEQSITEQLRRSAVRNSEQADTKPKPNNLKISPKTGLIAGGFVTFSFLSAFVIASQIRQSGIISNQASYPVPNSTSLEPFPTPLSSLPSNSMKGDFTPSAIPSMEISTTPIPFSSSPTSYSAEELIKKSERSMQTNDFRSAIEQLKKAVSLDASFPKTSFLLGEAYRAEGDRKLKENYPQQASENYRNSNVAYDQAIRLNPNEPSFHVGQGLNYLSLADSYTSLGQPNSVIKPYWDKALNHFRNAIARNENYADAYLGLGQMYSRQKGYLDLACLKLKDAKRLYELESKDTKVEDVNKLQNKLKCP